MASERSQMVRDHWRSMTEAAVANPGQTPEEVRERVERFWPALTAEPGGVDYLEVEVAGRPALWAVPKGAAEDQVVFSVHGGGGVSGSIYTHRKMFAHLAKAVGARALLVGYRQEAYPVPLEDTTTAYRWLLDQGTNAGHIAVVGDSIGGGLSVSTLLRARELGLPIPAALMLISPFVDMTVSNDTFATNSTNEAFFYKEVVSFLASAYLAGADPKEPLASPLYADLSGLPPTYVQVGEHETLLGESLEFEQNAREAGVDVRLDVFPEQQHTFQMAAGYSPESDDALRRLAEWVRPKIGLG
ncbi:alpha/beta hydrolase [Nonomuraea jiangxiensis]|uniref:Acetyl esterase/lipase n=1 Tax=Nonomuraea jiangxiensis TaxID=633440 RepID=A0A1G8XZD9_9ACTN|nr:alpha/beta hydrolase [Nonomuraea jiangxiensis]SDJ95892.1 Acetyl esterase/lipase [Nonomuraea jiangxiensis]